MFLNPTLCSLNSVDGSQLTVDPSVVYVGPGDNHNSHKELVHLHKHTRDTLHSLNNSLVRYSVYLGTCFTTQHWSDRVGFLSHCQYTLVQRPVMFWDWSKDGGLCIPGLAGMGWARESRERTRTCVVTIQHRHTLYTNTHKHYIRGDTPCSLPRHNMDIEHGKTL